MKELIDYKIVKKKFRRKIVKSYIPVYKEIGVGASMEKQIRAKEREL